MGDASHPLFYDGDGSDTDTVSLTSTLAESPQDEYVVNEILAEEEWNLDSISDTETRYLGALSLSFGHVMLVNTSQCHG